MAQKDPRHLGYYLMRLAIDACPRAACSRRTREINSLEGNVSSRDTFDAEEMLCSLGPRLLKEPGGPSIYIVQKGEVARGRAEKEVNIAGFRDGLMVDRD